VAELRGRLEAEQRARVQAETRLEAERKNLAEQRALLDEAEGKLKDAFKALSAEALKDSRTQFLSQADEKLRPIQSLLKDYEKKLDAIEKARNTAYGGLEQHLKNLASAHDVLQKEAHQLSTALRSPTVRGRWGELQLHRVVELAGMSPYCDFEEQASVETEEGRLRPDMIVHLPNDRIIVVDSKAPNQIYVEAIEAADEAVRRARLRKYADGVREHMRALGQKAYWSQFDNAPDFVVLFLPGESYLSAALEERRELIEEGMNSRVILATPTTLIALLRAVAYGWQQQQVAENAEKIADVGRELYERVRVFAEHFVKVGKGLGTATDAYNAAVGSYERNLEPGARKLAELGASSGKELPGVEGVEGPARALPEGET
jgi:DNA recombination protein RmuC